MTEKLGVIAYRPNLPKFGDLGVQYLQMYAIEGCEGWLLFWLGLGECLSLHSSRSSEILSRM